MQHTKISDGVGWVTWVVILVCFSVFRVLCVGFTFKSPGFGLGVHLFYGCVPGYRSPAPLLIAWQVCRSLWSGGLFSHSNLYLLCFYSVLSIFVLFISVSLISLLNKIGKPLNIIDICWKGFLNPFGAIYLSAFQLGDIKLLFTYVMDISIGPNDIRNDVRPDEVRTLFYSIDVSRGAPAMADLDREMKPRPAWAFSCQPTLHLVERLTTNCRRI